MCTFRPGLSALLALFVATLLALPASAQYVLNEYHYDPDDTIAGDANGDGTRSATQDEFVEILNPTPVLVNVTGYTLSDGGGLTHTFPSETYVRPNCGIVVFGGGVPTGDFGDMDVQTASSGSLSLNNGGDTITLNDGYEDIFSLTYADTVDDQAVTRDPDGSGAFTAHSTATGSGGALFSPGTMIDGSAFSGCAADAFLPIVLMPFVPVTRSAGGASPDHGGGSTHVVTVPAEGGTVNILASVTNNSGASVMTEVWPALTFPDGTHVVKRSARPVTIGAGETLMINAAITLFSNFPTGTYRYAGLGGVHPSVPLSIDTFIIEKEMGAPTLGPRFSTGPFRMPDPDDLLTFEVADAPLHTDAPQALGAAYPNPFNPTAVVPFTLTEAGAVRLAVYDVIGREVARLVDGRMEAGTHTVPFDAGHLPSGTYLVRFTAPDGRVETQRLTLLK